MNNIRNFIIISHVDHGKSTLADRLLELTGTVEARRMRPQYLDRLPLERERGITIKMAPVRMAYTLEGNAYILNLIDTPGHSDFSYEVSRALAAVEGAILLVDVSQGIQAQTIANFRVAERAGLAILGAVNKIDLNLPHVEKAVDSLAKLLRVSQEEIFKISGKTGQGVPELLAAVVRCVPPPREPREKVPRALVFDSLYDDHKGIVAFVRVVAGEYVAGARGMLYASGADFPIKEVGCFKPEVTPAKTIGQGEIGYIATGLKEPALVKIGDTITLKERIQTLPFIPLAGYREPAPVVFVSFYPDGDTKFEDLEEAFSRLRLNDAALHIDPEANDALGRGLRIGFLGQLHFEITSDRLSREFNCNFIASFPSVVYRVKSGQKEFVVKQPQDWPAKVDRAFQPMIKFEIVTPAPEVSKVIGLKSVFELTVREVKNMGEYVVLAGVMPLAELIRDFDDQLKSVSAGYASFSYELGEEAPAEVEKLEILLAGSVEPALTRIVPKKDLEREARSAVERLKEFLPREQFAVAIQAQALGRIIARETIPALKKDVTGYLYGGDRSRKMKLWKKQKRGKERLKGVGKVHVPVEVFRELLKK